MIRPTRTVNLSVNTSVKMYGVESGSTLEAISYFSEILFAIEFMEPYSVQVVRVDVDDEKDGESSRFEPTVRAFAPLKLLNVGSAILALAMLVFAITRHDGPAVVAIVLISTASSAHSLALYWKPLSRPRPRARDPHTIPSTTVIRNMNGAFIVVKCNADVAMQLLFSPPQNKYFSDSHAYRAFTSMGAVFQIFGIIALVNCTWALQVALGSCFVLLNALFLWISMSKRLSRRSHWALSSIRLIIEQDLEQDPEQHTQNSYLSSLWYAMYASQSVRWVRENAVTPNTEFWHTWLSVAEQHLGDPTPET